MEHKPMAETTTTNNTALTAEQIATITKEIEDFKKKSIEHAASAPALSAHYWRLYQASAPSMKRFDRMARTAAKKQAAKERKAVKDGKPTASAEGAPRNTRQSA
jgi:hypothetical protein